MKKTTILSVMAVLWPFTNKHGAIMIKHKSLKLKTSVFILMLLGVANAPISAQDIFLPIRSGRGVVLKVGDKLPPSFWTAERVILNSKSQTTANFQYLKGKPLILDFWASWCGACLSQFPKINQLQGQFKKHLNILLVNISGQDTTQAMSLFLENQVAPFNLSIVVKDQSILDLFTVVSIPHYIWIAADGKIKAITSAEAVNAAQLQRLIAGLDLNLKVKEN